MLAGNGIGKWSCGIFSRHCLFAVADAGASSAARKDFTRSHTPSLSQCQLPYTVCEEEFGPHQLLTRSAPAHRPKHLAGRALLLESNAPGAFGGLSKQVEARA